MRSLHLTTVVAVTAALLAPVGSVPAVASQDIAVTQPASATTTSSPELPVAGFAPEGSHVRLRRDLPPYEELSASDPVVATLRLLADQSAFEFAAPLVEGINRFAVEVVEDPAVVGPAAFAPAITKVLPPTVPTVTPLDARSAIVRVRDGAAVGEVLAAHELTATAVEPYFGFGFEEVPGFDNWLLVTFEAATVTTVQATLAGDDRVVGVYPVPPPQPTSEAPNDPMYNGRQWHLQPAVGSETWVTHTNMEAAWDVFHGTVSGGIPAASVAVMDTGLDRTHEDFDFANDVEPTDTTRPGLDPVTDECGHGTPVAGLAGANTGNGVGVAGTAWNVRLIPLKGGDPTMTECNIGADYGLVGQRQPTVLNMSYGRKAGCDDEADYNDATQLALWELSRQGVILLAAAGNRAHRSCFQPNDEGAPNYPSDYDGVTSVGAYTRDGQRAPYSNWGRNLDVVAPSDDFTVACPNALWTTRSNQAEEQDCDEDQYSTFRGTSGAAPQVSGLAALVADR